jgi:hypothetical protein
MEDLEKDEGNASEDDHQDSEEILKRNEDIAAAKQAKKAQKAALKEAERDRLMKMTAELEKAAADDEMSSDNVDLDIDIEAQLLKKKKEISNYLKVLPENW